MKLDMCVDETHNCRAHITEETVNKICIWKHLQHIKHWKRFEPRSRFISRLSMIISVNIVLAPVVQTLDSAIQWINIYSVDSAIGFPNTYPLDSDLSDG